MSFDQFETFLSLYEREKRHCASHYPDLVLTLNMEVDYHPEAPQKTLRFVELCDSFDCLLGSLHYYEEARTVLESRKIASARNYVATWKQAVQTGWFQVMSHYDFFKTKMGVDWYLDNFDELFDDLAGGIAFLAELNQSRARDGMEPIAIEVNTGGLQYGADPYLPTERLVAVAIEKGVPLCLSSDAHEASEVGRGFGPCLEMLHKHGLHELCYYVGKKAHYYSVQDAIRTYHSIDCALASDEYKATHDKSTWDVASG